MRRNRIATFVFASSVGLCCIVSSAAHAICPLEECTPNWELDCNSVCVPVTVGLKTIRVCDIDDNTGTDLDGVVFAVHDNSDPTEDTCESKPYCAWGSTTSGTAFYCEWDEEGDTLTEVHLKGGSADDYLSFLCEIENDYSVYLQEWVGYDLDGAFIGRITGRGGDDEIVGSRQDSSDYQDRVYAGGGADKVVTLQGDDYVEGGGHADWICTGHGDDGVLAGSGTNIVCTQWGDDSLTSGPDGDELYGGSNTDTFSAGGTGNTCDNQTGETASGCPSPGSYDVENCEDDDTGAPLECPE